MEEQRWNAFISYIMEAYEYTLPLSAEIAWVMLGACLCDRRWRGLEDRLAQEIRYTIEYGNTDISASFIEEWIRDNLTPESMPTDISFYENITGIAYKDI